MLSMLDFPSPVLCCWQRRNWVGSSLDKGNTLWHIAEAGNLGIPLFPILMGGKSEDSALASPSWSLSVCVIWLNIGTVRVNAVHFGLTNHSRVLVLMHNRSSRHIVPNFDGWEIRGFGVGISLVISFSLCDSAAVKRNIGMVRVIAVHFGLTDHSRPLTAASRLFISSS